MLSGQEVVIALRRGTPKPDVLKGTSLADDIYGFESGDTLKGLGGADLIYGGTGNDSIDGGDGADILDDAEGNDTIFGGAGKDLWFNGEGNDRFDGGGGVEDKVSFALFSSRGVVCDLAKTTAQNFGVFGLDILKNVEGIAGSSGNDKLYGTAGINDINGSNGNDFIDGRAGNDYLLGRQGADTIVGGAGADRIDLGRQFDDFARDILRYSSTADSGITKTTWDDVRDFNSGAALTADRIDLRALDADSTVAGKQSFRFVTGLTGAAQVAVANDAANGGQLVKISTDKDAAPEMIIHVIGTQAATLQLSAVDFIL